MSFHKPQPLIYSARDFGEQIRRAGIIQFVGFVDRAANFVSEGGEGARNGFDVGQAVGNRERILF